MVNQKAVKKNKHIEISQNEHYSGINFLRVSKTGPFHEMTFFQLIDILKPKMIFTFFMIFSDIVHILYSELFWYQKKTLLKNTGS